MNTYTAHITIMPLSELLDPPGKAVSDSLHKLGFTSIEKVRIGKTITLQLQAGSEAEAHSLAEDACKNLLYNAVMEQYTIVIQ